ncbi:hypothetical protein Adt_23074 [Abeliophyllum distichum]|uniref:Uncharacterized protein n=1 Tax=Abeliophyllum distichum TaxID=126358 RepID=A0ABD1S9U8_9LAMI
MEWPMDIFPCLATTRSHSIGRKIDYPGCVEGLCAKKKKRGGGEEAVLAGAADSAPAGVAEAAHGGAADSAPAGAAVPTGEAGLGRDPMLTFGPDRTDIWVGSNGKMGWN